MSRPLLAIDIGSSKISVVIAEQKDDAINIIGSGVAKSQGVRKGTITNIELTSRSIRQALSDAKRVAGTTSNKAIISISGAYTRSINSSGIVNIPQQEIGTKEINRVMQTALYNANIPNEYEVLHVLPYNFKVDEQEFIEDPFGMNASRLEVDTHIITTQKSNLSNLKKAVKSAGIEIENVVLAGYASAISILNQDEKELGVCAIDMGASTCNMVVHSGNSVRFNTFLAVGSNHITNDLSMALHTPLNIAEKIKIDYGSLKSPSNDLIEIPVIGDENEKHEISLEIVYNVIQARVQETLMILAKELEKSNLKEQIGAGIVLTGGMTKLDGIRELAMAIFDNMPVRIAKARPVDGDFGPLNDPAFATVMGLLEYAAGEYTQYEIDSNRKMIHKKEPIVSSNGDLSDISLASTSDTTADETPPKLNDGDIKQQLAEITQEENRETLGQKIKKMWHWMTQIF
ncbi:cell division protein FtsA [Hydrogenimonas thermophila]|uniref:Cell division protein FtsA n=1 Tax=Hydrogenimonas thermophila TaxID=223786 RepID=A0A1I5QNH5_9BACT|nr:cell division protein FtsA [Hydrogenimonas thermophila]WOE71154.1 cell division protein FtsA [Hydrogenimonas thermophila]WOE73672.1 cell division protein FtsA [Hydrogenimonas thermophila]SFP47581.1 cell division protein FtsA [Hydrogenimonas thermophila]